jgi:ribosome biogenesis GTPase / thiamine phosphate phosphatase
LNLDALGWGPFFADGFEPHNQDCIPARVGAQHRGGYVLYSERGELRAHVAGRLRHEIDWRVGLLPAVGDWVAAAPAADEGSATIQAVLPRRTKFSRQAAAGPNDLTEEQVLAANVDTVFLVSGLGSDLNARRLERYLTMGWESGAEPVIVLTKADLVDDADTELALGEVESIAFGVPVHAVSGVTGEGVAALDAYLRTGRTVALLGSSGVGKSTLVNHLSGREVLATQAVRADGRGRHTTTHRELVQLPGGAMLLDTPGMRELQLWQADSGLEATFDDVERVAANCRFSDCSHDREPGCAVRTALADGSLDLDRWNSYSKLQRELRALEIRQDARLQSEERKARRRMARSFRKVSY